MEVLMFEMVQSVGRGLGEILGPFDWHLWGRLLLVLILSGLIGWERSEHDRASGFRPHILVGLGACAVTMAGAYAVFDGLTRDPMRVASYVVSGVGFLGAGAILRHGTSVRGLTTAASLWGSAGLGVVVGVGMGWLAVAATVLILFTLVVLEKVEGKLGRGETARDLKLHVKDGHKSVGKALTALERLGVPVKQALVLPAANDTAFVRVQLSRPIRQDQWVPLIQRLLTVKSILRVDLEALQLTEKDATGQEIPHEPMEERFSRGQELNLADEKLLLDLNTESNGDGGGVTPRKGGEPA